MRRRELGPRGSRVVSSFEMCIFPPVSLCVHVLGLGEVLTREVDEGREDNGVDVLGKESSTEHVVLERSQVVDLRTAQETKNNKGERAPSLASLSSILLECISISPDMLRMPRAPVPGLYPRCVLLCCVCAPLLLSATQPLPNLPASVSASCVSSQSPFRRPYRKRLAT